MTRLGVMLGQQSLPQGATAENLRTVGLSRAEAEMMVRIVESVVNFAQNFPVEFHAYCPRDRWLQALQDAGKSVHLIEAQLSRQDEIIMVPADLLFRVVDLDECVSGARDARLSSAKLALIVSAAGMLGQTILGIGYLATPAYIISLALLLGRPAAAFVKEDPEHPFRPDTLSGTGYGGIRLGDHTDKDKVIERVIVSPAHRTQKFHWGTVTPTSFFGNKATCLSKGEWRVRVEGWGGDRITVADDWQMSEGSCESARNEIAVWERSREPLRDTGFPPVPADSGHPETFWIDYKGPLTEEVYRRAGPFG